MSGGAIWTIVAAAAAAVDLVKQQQIANSAFSDAGNVSDTPYRPAVWQYPALTSITIPGGQTSVQVEIGSGAPDDVTGNTSNLFIDPNGQDEILVFDAIIRAEHHQQIRKTEHPVQNGANVADHAFIMPARVELEIGMSDVMDSFTPGQWSDNKSKSVSAFSRLITIAKTRQAVTVTTRLATYTNMLLISVSSPDSNESRFGLRATAIFEELFTGTISQQQVSADPQKTDSTSQGTKQVQAVDPSLVQQHTSPLTTTVPNSGTLSSNVEETTGGLGS